MTARDRISLIISAAIAPLAILIFGPSFSIANQSFDHCPTCRKVETKAPVKAQECPNLTSWEDTKTFFKKWDDLFRSGSAQKKLSPHQQFAKFLTAFKEATKDFRPSLDAEDTDDLRATRVRLLNSVGWIPVQTWDQAKKVMISDKRILGAGQGLVCELVESRQPRIDCDGDLGLLNESERTVFLRRFESAVAEYVSEGITVDEMIRGRVIPTEGARARLLVAFMNRHGLTNSLVFAAPKSSLKISCESKVAQPLRFTIFSVGRTDESESVTLVNGTREGLLALQSFPAMGEWVSFSLPALPDLRNPAADPKVSLPVCFLNAKQVHEFACDVWRNQK
ncbi:MAG: hypothetical protein ABL958_01335 [Bdellovibrionia bacterium]